MTRRRRSSTGAAGLAIATLAMIVGPLAGCSGDPKDPLPESTSAAGTATPSPTASTDGSAVPTVAPTPTPGGTATPGQATSGGTAGPISASPVSCTSALPRRLGRVTTTAPRTTEVVTVVSDGRTLTSGTGQQTTFEDPRLTAADDSTVTDPNTVALVVGLVEGGHNRVLTTRPESPDARADVSRRPFDAPGTYALYNASGLLTAQVSVSCSGQEQTWQLEAEANPVNGTINCAVEPPRSNALARSVYQTSC